jgi:hypothetical protein
VIVLVLKEVAKLLASLLEVARVKHFGGTMHPYYATGEDSHEYLYLRVAFSSNISTRRTFDENV